MPKKHTHTTSTKESAQFVHEKHLFVCNALVLYRLLGELENGQTMIKLMSSVHIHGHFECALRHLINIRKCVCFMTHFDGFIDTLNINSLVSWPIINVLMHSKRCSCGRIRLKRPAWQRYTKWSLIMETALEMYAFTYI